MSLRQTYLNDAAALSLPGGFAGSGSLGWRSPSNIALIKYWGKMDDQFPRNPSLSFTLTNSFTDTVVDYWARNANEPRVQFFFEGVANDAFENRIKGYLDTIGRYLPFLDQLHLKISSSNSFPHSSGIASSASSMSALALCLATIEQEIFQTLSDPANFLRKAAFLARLGSGSATRSVYGGFVAWGETNVAQRASNEAGVPYELEKDSSYAGLNDAILVTSKGQKKVSSSHGHGMMNNHPYAEARYRQAGESLLGLDDAVRLENDEKFIGIIENEALSLHALMMSSHPGYNLLNKNTWMIIEEIREFRKETGLFITFSLDAGPNVHLIYKDKDSEVIKEFIKSELIQYCENGHWIDDKIGMGPVSLNLE